MPAYRRVYDSHHLQADCQELGSAPEANARQASTGYLFYTGESKSVTIILHSVDTIMSHVNKLDIVAAVRVCHSGSTNGSVTLDYICMTTLVA